MCSIAGCGKPVVTRGWCDMHYTRWKRHGSPRRRMLPVGRSALNRFMASIKQDGECWIWQGKTVRGYASLAVDGGKMRAHRWAYEHFIGPIPEGKALDHFKCDRPSCVNPHHVRPVDARENVLRGNTRPAANLAKTHCVHGHPFDEENTYVWKRNGARMCRRCLRNREIARRVRLKEQRLETHAVPLSGQR